MHFGGCGAFSTLQDFPQHKGVAVGLRYDINCPTPENAAHAQKSVSGLSPGSVVTYTCDRGFTLLSGRDTRTCAETGKWTGEVPLCEKFPCDSDPCQNGGQC